MKHAREDYNRIQDPAGLIPQDEPVFLLRGQDACAPAAIRSWAYEVIKAGGSQEIVRRALDQAVAMENWQSHASTGGPKVPDLPANPIAAAVARAGEMARLAALGAAFETGLTALREVYPEWADWLPGENDGYESETDILGDLAGEARAYIVADAAAPGFYLTFENDGGAMAQFAWTNQVLHALQFGRHEDAEKYIAIGKVEGASDNRDLTIMQIDMDGNVWTDPRDDLTPAAQDVPE